MYVFFLALLATNSPSRWLVPRRSLTVTKSVPGSEISSDPPASPAAKPVLRENSKIEFPSGILITDVTEYGVKLSLAEELLAMGDAEDALKRAKEALQIAGHTHEEDNVFEAYSEGVVGDSLYEQKDYKGSADRYRSALGKFERHYRSNSSPEAVSLVGAAHLVAWSFLSAGDYEEANHAWSTALGLTEHLQGPKAVDVAAAMVNLAVSHLQMGDLGPAPEALLVRGLRIFEDKHVVDYDTVIREHNGSVDEILADDTDGEDAFSRDHVIYAPICNARTILGHFYFQRGEYLNAIEQYTKVECIFLRGHIYKTVTSAALENYALLLWFSSRRDDSHRARALALLESALIAVSTDLDEEDVRGHASVRRLRSAVAAIKHGESAPSPPRGSHWI